MDERSVTERLRERAAADAKAFRDKFGKKETPNEKWLDNSFTAALPLVTEATELPGGGEVQPRLFAIYKEEVMRVLGMTEPRPDNELDRKTQPGALVQEPTPGEN